MAHPDAQGPERHRRLQHLHAHAGHDFRLCNGGVDEMPSCLVADRRRLRPMGMLLLWCSCWPECATLRREAPTWRHCGAATTPRPLPSCAWCAVSKAQTCSWFCVRFWMASTGWFAARFPVAQRSPLLYPHAMTHPGTPLHAGCVKSHTLCLFLGLFFHTSGLQFHDGHCLTQPAGCHHDRVVWPGALPSPCSALSWRQYGLSCWCLHSRKPYSLAHHLLPDALSTTPADHGARGEPLPLQPGCHD